MQVIFDIHNKDECKRVSNLMKQVHSGDQKEETKPVTKKRGRPAKSETKKPTVSDDVIADFRSACGYFAAEHGKDAMLQILKDAGVNVKKVSDTPEACGKAMELMATYSPSIDDDDSGDLADMFG